jgi:hypothetical protein
MGTRCSDYGEGEMNTVLAERLIKDLLDPEALGFAATCEIRDRARECIGLNRVETASKMDEFRKWLYANYHINNGDRLIELEEDMSVVEQYLKEVGLPSDTELKD